MRCSCTTSSAAAELAARCREDNGKSEAAAGSRPRCTTGGTGGTGGTVGTGSTGKPPRLEGPTLDAGMMGQLGCPRFCCLIGPKLPCLKAG